MMDPNTLPIPITLIMLMALLCWHVISVKGRWGTKLALFIIALSVCLMDWKAISSYIGWPTTSQIPEKALFLQGIVHEPEQGEGDPGAIYLWLLPLSEEINDTRSFLEYKAFRGEPRAYKMPYSREMHQAIEKARRMNAKGKPAVMQRGGKPGKEGQGDGGEGRSGEEGGLEGADGRQRGRPGIGYGDHQQDVQVYELPPAEPPKKDE